MLNENYSTRLLQESNALCNRPVRGDVAMPARLHERIRGLRATADSESRCAGTLDARSRAIPSLVPNGAAPLRSGPPRSGRMDNAQTALRSIPADAGHSLRGPQKCKPTRRSIPAEAGYWVAQKKFHCAISEPSLAAAGGACHKRMRGVDRCHAARDAKKQRGFSRLIRHGTPLRGLLSDVFLAPRAPTGSGPAR